MKRVALAFNLQIVDELPINEFDQPMDVIITEKRILENKAKR